MFFQKNPKLILFLFCKYFSNKPRGFMVQIFHKNAPGMEGHVPPLKFEIWSNELWILASSEIEPKIGIDSKNFQIHFSNTLFEEVMSSSLHDLNWMNLNSKGKSFYSLSFKSFKSFKFSLNFSHSIKQSIIQFIYLTFQILGCYSKPCHPLHEAFQ